MSKLLSLLHFFLQFLVFIVPLVMHSQFTDTTHSSWNNKNSSCDCKTVILRRQQRKPEWCMEVGWHRNQTVHLYDRETGSKPEHGLLLRSMNCSIQVAHRWPSHKHVSVIVCPDSDVHCWWKFVASLQSSKRGTWNEQTKHGTYISDHAVVLEHCGVTFECSAD